MNFITDLPPSIKLGVKILLMIIDWLSKRVILIPILSIFASAMATAFIKRYILSDITNKGLLNRVLSKHLRFIWKEAKCERSA